MGGFMAEVGADDRRARRVMAAAGQVIPWLMLSLLACAGACFAATGASGLHVVDRIAGPDGGWDYSSFDPSSRTLYVARSTEVLAINVDTRAVGKSLALGEHLHAAVPVPGTVLLVTTDAGDNTARIVNVSTGAVVATITTPDDPDAAIYDPQSGRVLVMCGDSGMVAVIDPITAKLVGAITVDGKLEGPALDGKGRLYVNDEEGARILVVDLASRRVVARLPLKDCDAPTGLAYVPGDRLLSDCANGVLKIVSASTGAEIASLPIGERPDAVLYDEPRKIALVPAGIGANLTVIGLAGDQDNKVVDTVPTELGARSGAVDPKTGRVFLPTAEFNLQTQGGQRPGPKPGSFHVLVLDR
jgi:DNA-binding beta-propeller fold protein YncE